MRILIPALIACVATISGCQDSVHPAPAIAGNTHREIVVTGGNGPGTTVFIPSVDPAEPIVYCTTGMAICPECKAAAVKYYQTGVLDPKCSRTGATRSVLISSSALTSGHN